MVNRETALSAHYNTGHFGLSGQTGVTLTEVKDLQLKQIAAWPETMAAVGAKAAAVAGCSEAPGPCQSSNGSNAVLIRIEPLKWWLLGMDSNTELPELSSDEGATLDASHSRTCVRIEGENAKDLLNRFLPIDLRDRSFGNGAVASTAFHHVGVTLIRRGDAYEMFIPRGFALSLWELLVESAEQFGVEVA